MLDLKAQYEYMKQDINAAIQRCLKHQQWILGPEVRELEEKIAEYLDVENCIGTSSGTDALVLALRALALRLKGQEYFDPSDLIITTPFTFTATGDAILRAGATPVFVDIDPSTYNIDPAGIREYLEASRPASSSAGSVSGPSCVSRVPSPLTPHPSRIVGIIPVHLYGQACDMDEIMAIAREYNLFVLEDVAQAFGADWKGKKLGSIGTAGAFSFFPSKTLGGFGDGGMVATNNGEIADFIRMLLKHGGRDKYNVDHIGYNARLDTLQAAILLAKFKYVEELNQRRRHIASLYNQALKGTESIVLPSALCPFLRSPSHEALRFSNAGVSLASTSLFAPESQVFHQYTIRVLNGKREKLQKYLAENGVQTTVYYPVPLHEMRVFQNRMVISEEGLAKAELAAKEVLSLPIPTMKPEEALLVADVIRQGLNEKLFFSQKCTGLKGQNINTLEFIKKSQ
ncbi:MAG: DegT/DnrJ/EryC1/StrS family aminotransferase [Deltaproteobacteria bacterium]|nr:DegT/DnrJ/EryC1/StrS family aminotransferase [Deltaproteobacteria bacterium]